MPPKEARVFRTKGRAPIMMVLEVFRPDEMAIVIRQRSDPKMLQNQELQN